MVEKALSFKPIWKTFYEIRGKQLAYLKAARMKMILETSITVTIVTVVVEITCLEMTVTCRRFHV
jgi:hypothetical protein